VRERVAIVGTGVAGLGCAWQLRDVADVTLIEKAARPGGHSNTVIVDEDGSPVAIDTGFIVFNHETYPNLVQLFKELGVEIKPSEMSFSVRHIPMGIEYNGMGLNKVFAQRANLLKPRFYHLLLQIMTFFRVAKASLNDPILADLSVAEFAQRHGLGSDFLNLYLVPMSSAVWSTEPEKMLTFPARSLIRFFENHGFLGVSTHHPWFTVSGGSKSYVEKILAVLRPVRLPAKVVSVVQQTDGVSIVSEDGTSTLFDRVIIAAHADEALAMLEHPTALQQRLLAPFHYQRNVATLHTDARVMPQRRLAWAAWNYRVQAQEDGTTSATTHYWMNALQGVSKRRDYFVSVNGADDIPAEKILYQTTYQHPIFTLDTMRAQEELSALNSQSPTQQIFFAGSYFRHGFHEDAYASAVALSRVVRPLLRP